METYVLLEGNMKKLIIIILSAILLLVSFSTIVSAENDIDEPKITYTFNYPIIIEKSKIIISGVENTENIGEPILPSIAANILIPYKSINRKGWILGFLYCNNSTPSLRTVDMKHSAEDL